MRSIWEILPADADRRIANYRRSRSMQARRDRPKKFFAAEDMTTGQYVAQWCRINGLRVAP